MIQHSPLAVAIIIACLGLMIGLAKGGFNALGSLLTPILSLVLPVSLAVGVLLPMLMVGDAFAIYVYWREWDVKLVWRMLSFWWVFLFIPLGIWLARLMLIRLNQEAFEWVVIVLLVLASGLLFWQSR